MNEQTTVTDAPAKDQPLWEKPCIEEVSQQVMAQPYIRFT